MSISLLDLKILQETARRRIEHSRAYTVLVGSTCVIPISRVTWASAGKGASMGSLLDIGSRDIRAPVNVGSV